MCTCIENGSLFLKCDNDTVSRYDASINAINYQCNETVYYEYYMSDHIVKDYGSRDCAPDRTRVIICSRYDASIIAIHYKCKKAAYYDCDMSDHIVKDYGE